MAEGLKLVSDILKRAKEEHTLPLNAYYGITFTVAVLYGITLTVAVLSDPKNSDLWERMVEYCEEVANA